MASSDETELTLRFQDTEIDLAVFENSVAAFFGLIRDAVEAGDRAEKWTVSVRRGSAEIAARGTGPAARAKRKVIVGAFESINSGGVPANLSSRGMQHMLALSRAVQHHPAELRSGAVACPIKTQHASRLELLQPRHAAGRSFSSVEGTLDGAWVEVKREFRVKAPRKSVRCTFAPELLSDVLDAIGKRALVYGATTYRSGEVSAIEVRRIDIIETPPTGSWRAARGALRT